MSAARVAILGASNIALAMPQLCAALTQHGVQRVDLVCGHGRSYGLRSSIPLRSLPAILQAPLWSELPAQTGLQAALLTDVGNDLVYGVPNTTILAWVNEAATRLEACGARIVLGGVPLASLRRLTRRRFELVRRVLFPFHPLRFEQAQAQIEDLQHALLALAQRRSWQVLEPRAQWYGLDPIHVRRRCRPEFAAMVAQQLLPTREAGTQPVEVTPVDLVRLRLLRPREERLAGCTRHGSGQIRLSGGLEVVCH